MQFKLTRARILLLLLASACFFAPMLLALTVPKASVPNAWRSIGLERNKVLSVYALRSGTETHYFALVKGSGVWRWEPGLGQWRTFNVGLPSVAWGHLPGVRVFAASGAKSRLYLALGDRPDSVRFYYQEYLGAWIRQGADFGRDIIRVVASEPFSNTVYAAATLRLYQSADDGLSWKPVSDLSIGGHPTVLEIHPNNPNELWLGTSAGEMWVSHDRGATWAQMNKHPLERWVHSVAIDPVETGVVYIAAGASVYRSLDAGEHWYPHTAGLGSGFTMALLADPAIQGGLFLGSNPDGVFYSADYGRTWQPFRDGMGRLGVNCLVLDSVNDVLIAGTDNGVWVRPLAGLRSAAATQAALTGTPFATRGPAVATPSPTATRSVTVALRTPTATPTRTRTATSTPRPTSTATPTSRPIQGPAMTVTAEPSITPTALPSPAFTPVVAPTATPTVFVPPTPTRPPR